MKGEIVRFRKKLFGGFNREDVVAYIAKLSQERNDSFIAKGEAEHEVLRLQGEISRLQAQVESYEKLIEKLKERAKHKTGTPAPEPAPEATLQTPGEAMPQTPTETQLPNASKKVILIKRAQTHQRKKT